jgi:hypothetical protein
MPTAGRDGQSWQLLRTGRAFRGDSTEPRGSSITLETCRVPPRRRRFEPVLSLQKLSISLSVRRRAFRTVRHFALRSARPRLDASTARVVIGKACLIRRSLSRSRPGVSEATIAPGRKVGIPAKDGVSRQTMVPRYRSSEKRPRVFSSWGRSRLAQCICAFLDSVAFDWHGETLITAATPKTIITDRNGSAIWSGIANQQRGSMLLLLFRCSMIPLPGPSWRQRENRKIKTSSRCFL